MEQKGSGRRAPGGFNSNTTPLNSRGGLSGWQTSYGGMSGSQTPRSGYASGKTPMHRGGNATPANGAFGGATPYGGASSSFAAGSATPYTSGRTPAYGGGEAFSVRYVKHKCSLSLLRRSCVSLGFISYTVCRRCRWCFQSFWKYAIQRTSWSIRECMGRRDTFLRWASRCSSRCERSMGQCLTSSWCRCKRNEQCLGLHLTRLSRLKRSWKCSLGKCRTYCSYTCSKRMGLSVACLSTASCEFSVGVRGSSNALYICSNTRGSYAVCFGSDACCWSLGRRVYRRSDTCCIGPYSGC